MFVNVTKATKRFDNGNVAYKNVSFSAQEGEIIGLVGTSGCGKSTLLRSISGLDPEYEGSVRINNYEAKECKESIGFMFQEPRLMPWLSVLDNVQFGSNHKQSQHAELLVEQVGLKGFEKHYPKELSGGMAQRAAIARALMTSPKLLLLDEPFSALDAFTKMQLQDLLLSVWEKNRATMLLVTHDIDEALYLCDRILVFRGQPGELSREIRVDRGENLRSRGDEKQLKQKAQILALLNIERSIS
ncbi:ABC transporter ATP-binding protein [Bacillus sp. BGMRC 2118]|nr:ABC transporter ATP-binding protein [Bacillus sp. BGMRC 2118]